ncbi:ROK family transcriptional regulator [Rhizobium helianthi]|uniref:ROK family transcriptional regulator n=1 Tax=Rhizobium helianthi TaxID=1132695 RepID=A0ABW4M0C4_9HYPH
MLSKLLEMQRLSYNQRRLLELLRRHQPIARANVTELTDLTQQSVHRLIEGLISDGLVTTVRGKPHGRGKPSPLLSLTGSAVHSLGISVDADATILTLTDFNCQVIARRSLTAVDEVSRRSLAQIRSACDQMLDGAGVMRESLCGLGFALPRGFPGTTDKAWSAVDLIPQLEAQFGLPIILQNDATATAIAESLVGVGQKYRSFALIAFNDEISGGLIIDGKPYFGHFGNAGELTRIFSASEQDRRPALSNLLVDLQAAGIEVRGTGDLYERFDPAWPGVAPWIDKVMPQVYRLIDALGAVLDPQAIVLGGALPTKLAHLLLERFETRTPLSSEAVGYRAQLEVCGLGRDGAAIGAALLPLKFNYFQ